MKVRNKQTGEIETLEYWFNGCNIAADIAAQNGNFIVRNGEYEASAEEIAWWRRYFRDAEAVNTLRAQLSDELREAGWDEEVVLAEEDWFDEVVGSGGLEHERKNAEYAAAEIRRRKYEIRG